MVDVRIEQRGVADLARITQQLKGAPREVRRELFRALQQATRPLIDAAREGARDTLPKAGGLAEQVAAAKIRPKLRQGQNPSLRLEASASGVAAGQFSKARSADKRRNRRRLKGVGGRG